MAEISDYTFLKTMNELSNMLERIALALESIERRT
jgi:hypothetical protein